MATGDWFAPGFADLNGRSSQPYCLSASRNRGERHLWKGHVPTIPSRIWMSRPRLPSSLGLSEFGPESNYEILRIDGNLYQFMVVTLASHNDIDFHP